MPDNILTAALTFSLLAVGTAVIGSEMSEPRRRRRLSSCRR